MKANKEKEELITQEYLKTILNYNPESGNFIWIIVYKKCLIGIKAGTLNNKDGYIHIKINKKLYQAHRLAWFYMTGSWPVNQIDHIDRNRINNIFNNLRDTTHNGYNRGEYNTNTSGYKGVYLIKSGRYSSSIYFESKLKHLGTFNTPEEAAKAYQEAKIKYHIIEE